MLVHCRLHSGLRLASMADLSSKESMTTCLFLVEVRWLHQCFRARWFGRSHQCLWTCLTELPVVLAFPGDLTKRHLFATLPTSAIAFRSMAGL